MRKSIPAALALLLLSVTASAPARFHVGTPAITGRECISLHAIRDESAEADDLLLFHVGGSRVYRNHLPKPCDDLRSINDLGKLKLHPANDDRLCRGDKITVRGTGNTLGVLDIGTGGSDTSCTLGDFEAISEMSLTEALRR
jgi:hypothetical protein